MTLKDIRSLFHRDLHSFIMEFDQVPEERLYLTTGTIINPAANLALHIAGNIRHYLGYGMGEQEYIRDRNREFTAKGISKQQIQDELQQALTAAMSALDKLRTADLVTPFPDLSPWGGYSKGFVLAQLLAHLNYHKGQLNYLRRFFDENKSKDP